MGGLDHNKGIFLGNVSITPPDTCLSDKKGEMLPIFLEEFLGWFVSKKGKCCCFCTSLTLSSFCVQIRGNAAHFLLRFCHFVVKIGRNASRCSWRNFAPFAFLIWRVTLGGNAAHFSGRNLFFLQFHNLEIWGKCCLLFLRESVLVCKFAMLKRVKFCSFFWSNFCSLSISQFADKPTSASPYLAFLFDSASDAPLLR